MEYKQIENNGKRTKGARLYSKLAPPSTSLPLQRCIDSVSWPLQPTACLQQTYRRNLAARARISRRLKRLTGKCSDELLLNINSRTSGGSLPTIVKRRRSSAPGSEVTRSNAKRCNNVTKSPLDMLIVGRRVPTSLTAPTDRTRQKLRFYVTTRAPCAEGQQWQYPPVMSLAQLLIDKCFVMELVDKLLMLPTCGAVRSL